MSVLLAIATGVLFGLGVFQVLRRDLIKTAIGFYILFTAINLFIMAAGAFEGEVPAYATEAENGQVSDPLVQALVLTAVVISFGSYGLLLALIRMSSTRFETVDSDSVDNLQA